MEEFIVVRMWKVKAKNIFDAADKARNVSTCDDTSVTDIDNLEEQPRVQENYRKTYGENFMNLALNVAK